MNIIEIRIDKIVVRNYRKSGNVNDELELQASIKEHGLILPVVVKRQEEDTFLLIAGKRRLKACAAIGFETIPAIIRDNTEGVQLVENIQRTPPDLLDEAEAVFDLCIAHKNNGPGHVAKLLAKGTGWVVSRYVIHLLPDSVKDEYRAGRIGKHKLTQIALLPADQQENWRERYNYPEKELSKARFNLDRTYGEHGPCTSCQFNSHVNQLFPDQSQTCSNASCYMEKNEAAYVEKAKEIALQMGDEPHMLITRSQWSSVHQDHPELFRLLQDNETWDLNPQGKYITLQRDGSVLRCDLIVRPDNKPIKVSADEKKAALKAKPEDVAIDTTIGVLQASIADATARFNSFLKARESDLWQWMIDEVNQPLRMAVGALAFSDNQLMNALLRPGDDGRVPLASAINAYIRQFDTETLKDICMAVMHDAYVAKLNEINDKINKKNAATEQTIKAYSEKIAELEAKKNAVTTEVKQPKVTKGKKKEATSTDQVSANNSKVKKK